MADFLLLAFVFLAAGVVAVPISMRLGLGSVIGYLAAGVLISPILALLGVDVVSIQAFAEFGVVMMLFLVGLDSKPKMLWEMRGRLLGLGGAQILVTTLAIAGVAMALGQPWTVALAIGLVLSLSSTAIVLHTLKEKGLSQNEGGQSGILVLLTQDLAIIPILAIVPLLAMPELMDTGLSGTAGLAHGGSDHNASLSLIDGMPGWMTALVTLVSIAVVLISGRYLTVPLFRFVAKSGLRELVTAAALLLVVGISLLMTLVGLSPALGTFVAGVALANSAYRHELEAVIDPFRGLLVGLFFMTVGAAINFALLSAAFGLVAGITVGLIAFKAAILFGVAMVFKIGKADRWVFALGLAQAGEFGFVLLSFSVANSVLPQAVADLLLLVISLSMLATPFLFFVARRLAGHDEVGGAWASDMVVFLSYSRHDTDQMREITGVLETRKFTVKSDQRDLPYGEEWKAELSYLIRSADVVVWLASSHSAHSQWCQWELGEVARYRKKLVPVVVGEIAPSDLPDDIQKLQLLPAQGVFTTKRRDHVAALAQFLGSDAAWIKEYTRLSDRAHSWDEAARNEDRLLNLAELQDAETWLENRPPLAPDPEPRLLDYLHSSRIFAQQPQVDGPKAEAVGG